MRGGLAAAGALGAGGVKARSVPANRPPAARRKQAQRYEATVPDTLDLAERARLALHGIAGTIDPADEYMMWFEVYWCNNPPYLKHSGCDVEISAKFLDAMTQLRLICGSEKYRDIEQGMEKALLSCLDRQDGLFYAMYKPHRKWHMAAYAGKGYRTQAEDYALPGSSGILMTALVLRHELGLGRYADRITALARGMEKISIDKGDYAYYPDGGTAHPFSRPRSGWPKTKEPGGEHEGGEGSVVAYFGYPIRALSMWAARTGDERFLEFARKLVRFVMKPKFWGHPADPTRVAGAEQGHVDSHLHARAIALRGLLEFGLVTGDTHVCDFVRSSYEFMRTFGINRIGFMPTWIQDARKTMEGCMLGDLVALTVKMSRAGIGDYWDDADRIIRNHLAEAQYTRRDLLERVSKNSPPSPPKGHPGQICTDNVLDRCLGIFASYLTPTSSSGRVMQCCTSNASRGLCYAWDAIVNGSGDEAQVNLLLNRASSWLDVDSYLPYEGKVVIGNKTARRIAVRIPVWVDRSKLSASVNGQPRRLSWVGGYQVFDDLEPSDTIELRFPVRTETIHRTAGRGTKAQTPYTLTLRGNTVVDISPRDQSPRSYPMYLRDGMRAAKAPMKTVQRFVAPQVARW